jgi:hypothetical protein
LRARELGWRDGRVRFVISLKSNGPMRFQLLHAIESGL